MLTKRRFLRSKGDGGETSGGGERTVFWKDMDSNASQIAACLCRLNALQEKVVRLRYGLGCRRGHPVRAIADALQMAPAVIGDILRDAEQRLAEMGWEPRQLRAAARDSQKSGVGLNAVSLGRARSCRKRLE